MSTEVMHAAAHTHDHHHDEDEKTVFGFWIYIMTDCILFATIFAVFATLRESTMSGLHPRELFSMPYVLTETMLLLTSSFTCGLALLGAHRGSKNQVLIALLLTFALGFGFIAMELNEFSHLHAEGQSWQISAYLSSFFTLVGTHGLHVTAGLIWMSLLFLQVGQRGVTPVTLRKLTCFSLFWHFLDIVWIFVFTVVYMMGVM